MKRHFYLSLWSLLFLHTLLVTVKFKANTKLTLGLSNGKLCIWRKTHSLMAMLHFLRRPIHGQPPQYVCYIVEWKLSFNHKKVGSETAKDLVVASCDYWETSLKKAVEDMLQTTKKRSERVRYVSEYQSHDSALLHPRCRTYAHVRNGITIIPSAYVATPCIVN